MGFVQENEAECRLGSALMLEGHPISEIETGVGPSVRKPAMDAYITFRKVT
jgi:hypothetical protein